VKEYAVFFHPLKGFKVVKIGFSWSGFFSVSSGYFTKDYGDSISCGSW